MPSPRTSLPGPSGPWDQDETPPSIRRSWRSISTRNGEAIGRLEHYAMRMGLTPNQVEKERRRISRNLYPLSSAASEQILQEFRLLDVLDTPPLGVDHPDREVWSKLIVIVRTLFEHGFLDPECDPRYLLTLLANLCRQQLELPDPRPSFNGAQDTRPMIIFQDEIAPKPKRIVPKKKPKPKKVAPARTERKLFR